MPGESEARTRRERIDPMLRAAGWKIVPYNPATPETQYERCAVTEYPTDNGPSDYALWVDGKILALVEAKKVGSDPQEVLSQDERYSRGLSSNPFNFSGFHVPFIYSSNGVTTWHRDLRDRLNRSYKIATFHTPDALTERLKRDIGAACTTLAARPNNNPRLRPYQLEANQAIESAIGNHHRQMLVAMATGTGKTFTMVNEIYRLMKCGVAKRILFLVDRRALAAQAVKAFASYEAEPGMKFDRIYEVYSQRFFREDIEGDDSFDPKVLPAEYLIKPHPGHAFVYVCTIQRMMINLFGRNIFFGEGSEEIEEDADPIDIPIHAFDLIIADECHRGYTSKEQSVWRATLEHFDALKIGLTATPASHTTAFFRQIVYRYEYERAVREGFLVDYDAVNIDSDVRMNGIFLHTGEQVDNVDPETGQRSLDMLEDERRFETTEVERKVTSPDSNRKILLEIKKYADQHEAMYGRFPKTLIFAANDLPHTSHADQLADLAKEIFGRGDGFVRKITGKVDRPLQRIREFRNRPEPGIAVTVDLLSTGVDIPDLEYIVFLRQLESRILFEQMIGRGTRRGEHFPDKSHFVVFDCFGGTLLEYFRNSTGVTKELPVNETRTIVQVIKDIWDNRDRNYNTNVLVKRLQRIDKEMSGEARTAFSRYIADGNVKRYASGLAQNLIDDFTGAMTLLQDKDFQDLLMHYKRAARTFIISYDTVDTVTSEMVIRDSAGHTYKPEDYLTAFSRFVKENPEHIAAIQILLDRPKEWSTTALSELKRKLATTPQQFTVTNLQRAHEVQHRKAIIDIISMVKHAGKEESPLLTAEERITLAFEKVTAGKEFSPEQQQWLDRIRLHLVENLSIDRSDFDTIPVLEDAGGWGRANRVFDNQLDLLLRQFNEAVAA